MARIGWSFWVKQGKWRDVYWVAIADVDSAKTALISSLGDEPEIEDQVKVDTDTLCFLGLSEGEIARGHMCSMADGRQSTG